MRKANVLLFPDQNFSLLFILQKQLKESSWVHPFQVIQYILLDHFIIKLFFVCGFLHDYSIQKNNFNFLSFSQLWWQAFLFYNPSLMKRKPFYSRRNSLNITSSTYLIKFVSKIVKIHRNIWYLNWQICNFRSHIISRRNVFWGLIFWEYEAT